MITARMPTPMQLRCLIAMSEHGSYVSAGSAVHRDRQTVKYHVTQLQDNLGRDLVVPSGSGSSRGKLSATGMVLACEARVLLESMAKFGRAAS